MKELNSAFNYHFPNYVTQFMVASAILLSLAALIPIKRIYDMLAVGITRITWALLALLISLSAIGYGVFLRINYTEGTNHREDLLVALLFLATSVFVVIVCILSHRTADEVSRISALELAASIDPVTELYNRRHIMSILDSECLMSKRDQYPLSVLMVDIDGFKKINDTYGHLAGDFILNKLATLFSNALIDSRLIGRYGGEEFLVILPNTASALAGVVAERLRSLVEQTAILYADEPIITPTISIGVATSFGWEEGSADLISIADEALYAAKAAGRNRVCHAFEPSGKTLVSQMTVISPLEQ